VGRLKIMGRCIQRPKPPIPRQPRTTSPIGDVVGHPKFAPLVHGRFPDHCACWGPLYTIANQIVSRSEGGHRLAVLFSACAGFNSFTSVILLALNGLGPDAMLVCRSLLETAMGTIFLAADSSRTDDYLAYAKIVGHKIAKRLDGGQHPDLISATQIDYQRERCRFPKKQLSWHQLRNDNLAGITGFGDLYDDHSPLSSSIAHGDLLAVTARFTPKGRFQPPPAWEFVGLALELGAEIAARMFNQVNALLALGLEEHIDQVLAILDRIEPKRSKARRFLTAAVSTST
jgi:hypothetical protein